MDAVRKIVPSKQFNVLAWVVGASDDPEEAKFAEVSNEESRRILNVAQDIIFLATRDKKTMPKNTALAMAVRHPSGSSQLTGLLNGSGYCVSHTSMLEHDTALAQQEIHRG